MCDYLLSNTILATATVIIVFVANNIIYVVTKFKNMLTSSIHNSAYGYAIARYTNGIVS